MLTGADVQSVLAPAGTQSSTISQLWWLMFGVSAVVFVLTMTFVVAALVRGVARVRSGEPAPSDRQLSRGVAVAVGATVVILIALLVVSVWGCVGARLGVALGKGGRHLAAHIGVNAVLLAIYQGAIVLAS